MKTNHTVLIAVLVLLVLCAWTTAPQTPKPVVVEGFFADWIKQRSKNRDALAKRVNSEIRRIVAQYGEDLVGTHEDSSDNRISVVLDISYVNGEVYTTVRVDYRGAKFHQSKTFSTKGASRARIASLKKEFLRLHGKYIDLKSHAPE